MKRLLILTIIVMLLSVAVAGCANNNTPGYTVGPNTPGYQDGNDDILDGDIIPGYDLLPGIEMTPGMGVTPVPGTEPGAQTEPGTGMNNDLQEGQTTPGGNLPTKSPSAS